jgi:hypothetical protein
MKLKSADEGHLLALKLTALRTQYFLTEFKFGRNSVFSLVIVALV